MMMDDGYNVSAPLMIQSCKTKVSELIINSHPSPICKKENKDYFLLHPISSTPSQSCDSLPKTALPSGVFAPQRLWWQADLNYTARTGSHSSQNVNTHLLWCAAYGLNEWILSLFVHLEFKVGCINTYLNSIG